VIRDDLRHGLRLCPTCDRGIALTRDGRFRRHYDLRSVGRKLCAASRTTPDGVVQLLRRQPTPEQSYAHALSLIAKLRPEGSTT
jgi:hypothetical protein